MIYVFGKNLSEDARKLIDKMFLVVNQPYKVYDLASVGISNLQIDPTVDKLITLGLWTTRIILSANFSPIQFPHIEDITKPGIKEKTYQQLLDIKNAPIYQRLIVNKDDIQKAESLQRIICKDSSGNKFEISMTNDDTGTIITLSELAAIKLVMDTFKQREVEIIVRSRNDRCNS